MPIFLVILVALRVVSIIHRMMNERKQRSDVGLVTYGVSKLLYTTGWIVTAIFEVTFNGLESNKKKLLNAIVRTHSHVVVCCTSPKSSRCSYDIT